MEADGLIEKVDSAREFNFSFNGTGPLPPPVLSFTDVSFSYDGILANSLYRHLELGVDTESRVALVGPNGAGIFRIPHILIFRQIYTFETHEW